ncbi:bi-domain-containing oxidoreductase [Alphaproteobacteria bacterium]|nr:bi-domain-containing oxidoreductase [Alphaproteobacteria bacterium]
MKQVFIHNGNAVVSEVPAPKVGQSNLLVSVKYSCISVGTEMASVNNSGMRLYKRALKQPANVKRVIEMAKNDGLAKTIGRVTKKLSAWNPCGYSASGTVVAIGKNVTGFSIGDEVACAGAGIANHAEVIDVPVNLAARVPASVSLKFASTVTLGAIAIQGIRRAQPTLGEMFVVVGLGVLGQLTAQILEANGCRVVGIDLDPFRIDSALAEGMEYSVDPSVEDYVERVIRLTDGHGADGVIITAASASHQIVSQAMNACRKKGRVVVVGDVGLNLDRSDFYTKELDFLISTSYGPGRYDPLYEEEGQDYPLPYVRWTENRNMSAYLHLLASNKVNLENLCETVFPIEKAAEAYNTLKSDNKTSMMVLLEYPSPSSGTFSCKVSIHEIPKKHERINVGIAGASSFAQGMHLPNLNALSKDYCIHAIMSRTGSNALSVANQYKASYGTTSYADLIGDEAVDLILIATRHDLHASMTLEALNAGKHVFVEKPLALNFSELKLIEDFYLKNPNGPLLMVGFNRRFSPVFQKIKRQICNTTTPILVNYTMNAGYIPPNHWTQGSEGGGRNLGEACHIYDLFNALCNGELITSVDVSAINPPSGQWFKNDNFVATIKYQNGSVCTLTYTSMGNNSYPKEKMEVFYDGKVLLMEDYKRLTIFGKKSADWHSKSVQKGQKEELGALADSLLRGMPWPIALKEQIKATKISLNIEEKIMQAQ